MNLCLKSYTVCLYFILSFRVWIRNHTAPEYRSNTDPDPQHCFQLTLCSSPVVVLLQDQQGYQPLRQRPGHLYQPHQHSPDPPGQLHHQLHGQPNRRAVRRHKPLAPRGSVSAPNFCLLLPAFKKVFREIQKIKFTLFTCLHKSQSWARDTFLVSRKKRRQRHNLIGTRKIPKMLATNYQIIVNK